MEGGAAPASFAGAVGFEGTSHPRIGAGLPFVFLVPTALTTHAFWRETDPMQRAGQKAQLWKKITLVGGMLWIIANTSWPWPWALG